MNRFTFERAETIADAIGKAARRPTSKFLGGGTNLVDLIKENVERPDALIGLQRLPLNQVENTSDGGLRIGASVTNADAAYHPEINRRYPLLSQAILAGASPQLRNMATTGGNLLQRTRCYYFYDPLVPCNKREPGSGCPALSGLNRIHAILGTSDQCIAVHPSDMCVALAALEAQVHVESAAGTRVIPFAEFHRLPGSTPQHETNLAVGELITAVDLPAESFSDHFAYLKIRDRDSYAFALVSVAAALRLEGGRIADARLALGGVAHKPWRDASAEALLVGEAPTDVAFSAAAQQIVAQAKGYEFNTFKITLAQRAVKRALQLALAGNKSP